ncbi:MAG: calcium/sodium antiporter [Gemmatimonadales bacterium]|nr:calcium/sodium antiporter [Gemmatimonadales bacterium]
MTTIALLLVVGGIAMLAAGGELLVRGAVTIARHLKVSPAVIGLTVVAMGTSLPELAASLAAALRDAPDVAIGNVVGSNIINVAGIAATIALLRPLPVYPKALRLEWPFMFLASWVGFLLARDGTVDRLEGGFLLLSLVLFSFYMARLAQSEAAEAPPLAQALTKEALGKASKAAALWTHVLFVAAGIALLTIGGRILVKGAIDLATIAGVSERIIGLTLVAVGTSLPELAATLVAARRGHAEMALANVIGSNIFNILGVLGTVALVRPIPVTAAILSTDMWWMLGFSLLLFPLMQRRRKVAKTEGVLLLVAYVVYLVSLK